MNPAAVDADPEGPLARVPLQELVGSRLGDYEVKRVLGHGSMGVVFEAVHTQLGRRVALKALPPGLGATEKAIQRFLREAQAVAQLSHENIVPIYEIACEGTIHYYAMQFLEGEPLDRVLKRGPLDARHAARLALTAARAIHFAHQRGIIHRDIKPANLIVNGDGRLVLTDFGLARPEQGDAITDSGAMVGTPLYMSPEQVRARKGEIDRRTDVYSLGATLYEMVAGRPPFTGESTQEILQAILEQEPRSPRSWISAIPADLEVITLRALEKEPKRRYASALEMAQDLERFLENEPVLARRTSGIARAWRRVKKHKTIAILSLVVAVISLGSAWAMKFQRDSANARGYRDAMEVARSAMVDESYDTAKARFADALRVRPGDLDAQLGRARALCFLGQQWESANQQQQGKETSPALALEFGSVEKLYADALELVRPVAENQPRNALAVFYRGFIGWRMRGKLEVKDAPVEDLTKAETLGEEDWETQAELAKFRLGLARDPKRDAAQKGELLQQALTNASRATRLADERALTLPPRLVGRVHRLRGEIYSALYDTSGNLADYLDLALADFQRAKASDPRDPQLLLLESDLESRRNDAAKSAATSAAATTSEPADRSDAPVAAPEVARGLMTLLGVAQKSEQSKALAELVQKGSELLAAGWQQTDGFRGDLMDQFVNPYLPQQKVSEEARSEAAAEADKAYAILRSDVSRDGLTEAERRTARDHLRLAVEKNTRNAQYFFDLALVEQSLGELAPARVHLQDATRISSSNPLFVHQLALVCEQMRLPAEAVEAARRTEELAPDNADFVADHARLALDAEATEADTAKRSARHQEAAAAVARLERLAKEHAQLAGLLQRLAAASAPAPAPAPARDG